MFCGILSSCSCMCNIMAISPFDQHGHAHGYPFDPCGLTHGPELAVAHLIYMGSPTVQSTSLKPLDGFSACLRNCVDFQLCNIMIVWQFDMGLPMVAPVASMGLPSSKLYGIVQIYRRILYAVLSVESYRPVVSSDVIFAHMSHIGLSIGQTHGSMRNCTVSNLWVP